jgi:hypothetical protein
MNRRSPGHRLLAQHIYDKKTIKENVSLSVVKEELILQGNDPLVAMPDLVITLSLAILLKVVNLRYVVLDLLLSFSFFILFQRSIY